MSFFRKHEDIFSVSGSPVEPIYRMKVDKKTGTITLAPTGEFDNVQERIDSFVDSGNVTKLLERIERTGDMSLLNQRAGAFFDASILPTNTIEMMELRQEVDNFFDDLPPTVKEEFNFDKNEFFGSLGTDEFVKRMQKFVPDHDAVAVADNIVEVSKGDVVNESEQ